MTCPICAWTVQDRKYLHLQETKYWHAVLAPNQCLVGRSILQLKRHCSSLSGLTDAETLDWLNLVKLLENALRAAFDATMFNWSCYMNLSYQELTPDPHVHWWVVPRYNHPVQLESWIFEDPQFGHPYNHDHIVEVPSQIHQKIAERIIQGL